MRLYLQGHTYQYAVQEMLFTLFPGEKALYPEGEPDGTDGALQTIIRQGESGPIAEAVLWWNGGQYTGTSSASQSELTGGLQDDRVLQRILRLAMYQACTTALGHEPPWGALTGVRPAKLTAKHMENGREGAAAWLREVYHVEPSRAALAAECAEASVQLRNTLSPNGLSLYIGIPFCPSRCAYCSFISADVKGALAMVEPYTELLCREIREAGEQMKSRDLFIETAYMGGGTPTTLSAEQLRRVLETVRECLPMDRCREITVEAGRPDTITREKLAVLKELGIQRISINPQTMENAVLRAMGRAHTAEQITEAMALAKEHFGGMVNMDLIAGLPTDTTEGFARSLEQVLAMDPANITVHTLALKKGSRLSENPDALCTPETVSEMLRLASDALSSAGYRPYYLYRQKYMSGSFENVGWCKPGTLCAYNIVMMEELQTVLSLGAGGVTKLVDPATGHIKRITNPKYPHEYRNSWEKLAAAKAEAAAFQAALAAGEHFYSS